MSSNTRRRSVLPRPASVPLTAAQLNAIPPRPQPNTQQTDVPLLIAGTTTEATNQNTDATFTETNAEPQPYVIFNTEANRHSIRRAVNDVLFPNIKFISSKLDLIYSTNKQSMAQIILTNLNIPADPIQQTNCWAQIRNLIPEMLNRKRTTITYTLRTKFDGT